jgi:hypothetical protein
MRTLFLSLTLATAISAAAQQSAVQPAQPRANSAWERVQTLPAGLSINVKSRTTHASCKLKTVDADSLTCTHGKDIVFQRTDILNIKAPHRGRSTLVGLVIGGGAGAGVGAGITAGSSCKQLCIVSNGDVVAITALAGGIVGAITGAATDFTRSAVYKAP